MTKLRPLLFSIALLAPLAAHAGDAAGPHIAKATEAHKAGRFADALSELEIAYKLDPRPELLFALGQVNVKLDRCDAAVGYYQQYLATSPSAQATADTRQAIETCKAKMTPVTPPPPAAPPPTDSPYLPGTTAPPAQSSDRAPFYKDKVGDALVIGGVAATVVGVVLYASARGDLDDAETAPDLSHYNDLVDSAHNKRTWSVVLVGGGVALAGAGIVHYMLHGTTKETRGVGMVPASGGGLVTWTGRF